MASSSLFRTSNLTTTTNVSPLAFKSSASLCLRLHNFIPTGSLRTPSRPIQIACSLSDAASAASSPADSHLPPRRRRLSRPDYVPNRISDPNYVRIFDTTLRDGEQAPGASLMLNEKIEIARQLALLGVDIIEAGFPAASEEEFKAVKAIAQTVGKEVDQETGYVPVICGASRCNEKDIKIAWDAVKYAKRPRIHSFISTSDIHLKYKLRKTREEVVEIATRTTRYARSLGCDDIQIGLEDAARADLEFLYLFTSEVIKAGATTVSLGDTVGIQFPDELAKLVADLKANTPGIENVIVACHCHNDLGFATANTVAGACAGARQLEMTINGIGERAGNASFEEVVMSMKCRGEELLGGLYTGIDTRHISKTSKMVEEYTGLRVQPHKPIVGANVFVHGSGIHQDGILKHKSTYEILRAEDIGTELTEENAIFLGKLSGRNGLKDRLKKLGYEYEGEQLNSIFSRFKAVAAHKKQVTDADLISLVSDGACKSDAVWKLHDLQVTSGTLGVSTAKVKLVNGDGEEKSASATGNGPLETAFKAVDVIVKEPATLMEYSIDAVTEGIDSIVSTRVLIRGNNYSLSGETGQATFSGTGAGMDIIVSSVRAYIDALNKMSGSKKALQVKMPEIAETASVSV